MCQASLAEDLSPQSDGYGQKVHDSTGELNVATENSTVSISTLNLRPGQKPGEHAECRICGWIQVRESLGKGRGATGCY